MSTAGKGDAPRPLSIPRSTFESRMDAIFNTRRPMDMLAAVRNIEDRLQRLEDQVARLVNDYAERAYLTEQEDIQRAEQEARETRKMLGYDADDV